MSFVGKKVKHKSFGDGVIIAKEGSKIAIKFDKFETIKNMIYPLIFEKLATIEDEDLYKIALNDITILQEENAKTKEKEAELRKAKEELKKAEAELHKLVHKGNRTAKNPFSNELPNNVNFLEYRCDYGINSKKIYQWLCETFQFDQNFITEFGRQGGLQYARCATPMPERYSVWMPPHSNLTQTKAIQWENIIDLSNGKIIEYYKKELTKHYEPRLTFAKLDAHSGYSFIGVFEVENVNIEEKIVTYKLISKTYPI